MCQKLYTNMEQVHRMCWNSQKLTKILPEAVFPLACKSFSTLKQNAWMFLSVQFYVCWSFLLSSANETSMAFSFSLPFIQMSFDYLCMSRGIVWNSLFLVHFVSLLPLFLSHSKSNCKIYMCLLKYEFLHHTDAFCCIKAEAKELSMHVENKENISKAHGKCIHTLPNGKLNK